MVEFLVKDLCKIGNHKLEITYSRWTYRGKIKIDDKIVFSKMMFFKRSKLITIDNDEVLVKFGGILLPNIKIRSRITSDSQIENLMK